MIKYDILLVGRTPASAVLATRLAQAGRSVALIDDGTVPNLTGSIRWLTLRDLGLGRHPHLDGWPLVQSCGEIELLEGGARETTYRSDRFNNLAHRVLVVQTRQLIDLMMTDSLAIDQGAATPQRLLYEGGKQTGVRFADGSEIGARLTIVSSGNRLLLGATDRSWPVDLSPPFFERIELTWITESSDASRQIIVTGGQLDLLESDAILFRLPDRIVLSLVCSIAALVQEGIVVTDVLDDLLANPAVTDLPALSTAGSVSTTILRLPERVNLERYSPGRWVMGALEGLSDPASFDREVNLARAVATELCSVPADRYESVALPCAVSGIVRMSHWARPGCRRRVAQAGLVPV